jgi:hypothetical protein
MSNLWMNISSKKQIVYHSRKTGIQSLFVLIRFEIDQFVPDEMSQLPNDKQSIDMES